MRSLVLLTVCLIQSAMAAPFAVQLGDTRVALDTPPGFADVQATGSPRLLELAEALTSASNRILLFALEDIDVRRFTVGDTPEFRRYVLIVTPKAMEATRVTHTAFRQLVSDAMRDVGKPAPASGDLKAYLDANGRAKPALIAELRKDPDVESILQGQRAPEPPKSKDPPKYLLQSTTLLFVRGRALNMALYTMYDSPADVDWLRAATLRWVEDVQRLNNR